MGIALIGIYKTKQEAKDAIPELKQEFPGFEDDRWIIFEEEDGTYTVNID
jgi:hypothetical protein